MKYIIANWKMAPANKERAEGLFNAIIQETRSAPSGLQIIVCPPFVWIPLAREILSYTGRFALGAQDLAMNAQGAFTGEISASMLASLGVTHVIVGHSERRALGESNDIVLAKLKTALGSGLSPILCVGEQTREGDWHTFLRTQIDSALMALAPNDAKKLIVAYEPVWAIGGQEPDTPDSALTSIILIRKITRERFGDSIARTIPILYGGSVLPETVGPFVAQEGIDGVLVGRASMDAGAFSLVVRAFASSDRS